jgi:hypothetical protein
MSKSRELNSTGAVNGRELGDADVSGVPLNTFESEIFDCLEAAGLKLIPQMGASGFRIDMVVQHPAKPGRYVLAIRTGPVSDTRQLSWKWE